MRRRAFLALVGGAAAMPGSVVGQAVEPMRRIGVLTGQSDDDADLRRWFAGFDDALRQLGWSDGRNLRIDYRAAAGDLVRMRAYAAELVGLRSEVLVGHSTPATRALRQATDAIPIVFVSVADPLGGGLVESLARPGGNSTGFTNFDPPMGGKWLQLLRDIAPRVERVGMLFSPETAARGAAGGIYLPAIEAAARAHGLELVVSPVHDPAEIDRTVASLAREPGGGMLVMPNVFTLVHRQRIVDAAAEYRLPTVYALRAFVTDGGLMTYGADVGDAFRRAASYVDRLLKGAKAGELPVQAPTKFELVLNLKAARALDLPIPQPLLVAADEVIE